VRSFANKGQRIAKPLWLARQRRLIATSVALGRQTGRWRSAGTWLAPAGSRSALLIFYYSIDRDPYPKVVDGRASPRVVQPRIAGGIHAGQAVAM
jgi:hypothetical protein